MSAVLVCVVLALVAAGVTLVDVAPWRRPPVLEVTITIDTTAFSEAMARAGRQVQALGDVWARTGPTFAQATARMQELGRALWRDEYERTKDWPATPDPSPFPRLRWWRWLR